MSLTSLRATLLAALLCLLPLAASAAPTLAQTRFHRPKRQCRCVLIRAKWCW
jgi:P pilus assembly chaperone PapD